MIGCNDFGAFLKNAYIYVFLRRREMGIFRVSEQGEIEV